MLYKIGPSSDLKIPQLLNWDNIGPGDIVEFEWRPEPYDAIIGVQRSGKPGQPIVVRGVANQYGQKPVLDGMRARKPPNAQATWWNQERGGLTFDAGDRANEHQEYLEIRGLRFQNYRFKGGYYFTDYDQKWKSDGWAPNVAAIRVRRGNHIVIEDNEIHDCSCAIFVGTEPDPSIRKWRSKDLLIQRNKVTKCSNPGSGQEHPFYTEGLGTIYRWNHIECLADGGNLLKLRDRNLEVEGNVLIGGNRDFDVVSSKNHPYDKQELGYEPYVYMHGNIIIKLQHEQNCVGHVGYDADHTPDLATKNFWFYNNTVLVDSRGTEVILFDAEGAETVINLANNLFYVPNFQPNAKGEWVSQDTNKYPQYPYYGVSLTRNPYGDKKGPAKIINHGGNIFPLGKSMPWSYNPGLVAPWKNHFDDKGPNVLVGLPDKGPEVLGPIGGDKTKMAVLERFGIHTDWIIPNRPVNDMLKHVDGSNYKYVDSLADCAPIDPALKCSIALPDFLPRQTMNPSFRLKPTTTRKTFAFIGAVEVGESASASDVPVVQPPAPTPQPDPPTPDPVPTTTTPQSTPPVSFEQSIAALKGLVDKAATAKKVASDAAAAAAAAITEAKAAAARAEYDVTSAGERYVQQIRKVLEDAGLK